MSKNALIIGGGVAGCSCAYYLGDKGWDCTIIEASDGLGGMSHTKYFNGHPYEFGPHLWFWPHDDINAVIRDLGGEMFERERNLISYSDGIEARYPLHYQDIQVMPDFTKIYSELRKHRNAKMKLNPNGLPIIGECTFKEYFEAVVGPTLYHRFMGRYTHKMWGIDGDTLTTKMVWADRIKSAYTDAPYDPIKFEDQGLGKGLKNWYPVGGWNPVWEGMAALATVRLNTKVDFTRHSDIILKRPDGTLERVDTTEYDVVIWTLHTDTGKKKSLGGQGRVILPLLFPGRIDCGDGVESLHLSDKSPVTRITDMSMVTGVDSPGILYLFELPGVEAKEGSEQYVNQWYEPRCYNHLSDENIELNKELSAELKRQIPNIHFCGRHAEFKYYGMPQVVDSARRLCETL